ncbi:hypothetical protein [Nocardiopsis sp. NPDC006832]|uniref:hypothetical protein n=1 Tax=Nocardiopsis sp. NPDC006832 TaxID=3157188 RepID=UPI00340C86BC
MGARSLALLAVVSLFSTALPWGSNAWARTAEGETTELSEIAEALREDPVYVDDHMAEAVGAETIDEIRSYVEGGPQTVYVVLAEVDEETGEAPALIAARAGVDGVYHMGHGFGVAGTEDGAQESIRLADWKAEEGGVEPTRPELLSESIRLFQRDDFVKEYNTMVAETFQDHEEKEEEGDDSWTTVALVSAGLRIGLMLLVLVGVIRLKWANDKKNDKK